ncbi:MAG: relaxase domain-containing protein [Paracoccaceae bacterium]|nr:relaxase domain-containing protein [Paracoccaceae bacterium]
MIVASIGKIASPAQGVGYFEKDGYYAKDDGAHREASAWADRAPMRSGSPARSIRRRSGTCSKARFPGTGPGQARAGDGSGAGNPTGPSVRHRPGRDVTLSAPKSVSLMAMVSDDERIVGAHDKAVSATLGWVEANAIENRMPDPGSGPWQAPATGAMVRAGDQKIVAATFRHDTPPNLDPQLHTHAVVANMVQCGDGKWRTMVDDGLFNGKMAIRAIYRAELAAGFRDLGYGIEHTHADGRFEIEGVSREVIDAFSTRRAEIEAAMTERGVGESKDNPHLAAKAALLTRAAKRDIDRDALERGWKRQAVFGHADLLAATLSRRPPPPAPFRPASPPRPR